MICQVCDKPLSVLEEDGLTDAREAMKTDRFTYEVGIVINFTDDELELLRKCCGGHYDGTVRGSALRGGFLYGWLNMQRMGMGDIGCSFRQLDTCAKALEQPSQAQEAEEVSKARWDLRFAIMGVLKSLNERARLMAGAEIVPA